MRQVASVSKNVSTGGILLRTTSLVPLHTAVALTMQLRGALYERPVQLVAEGEVVRVERSDPSGEFAIAVECRDPMTELNTCA